MLMASVETYGFNKVPSHYNTQTAAYMSYKKGHAGRYNILKVTTNHRVRQIEIIIIITIMLLLGKLQSFVIKHPNKLHW